MGIKETGLATYVLHSTPRRCPTLAKIAYLISKSFDFIEIINDFNKDFRLQKSIKCVGDSTQDILDAYKLEKNFRRLLIKCAIIYRFLISASF